MNAYKSKPSEGAPHFDIPEIQIFIVAWVWDMSKSAISFAVNVLNDWLIFCRPRESAERNWMWVQFANIISLPTNHNQFSRCLFAPNPNHHSVRPTEEKKRHPSTNRHKRKWISGTRKRCVQPSTYLDDDWVIVECLCAFLPYTMWFNLFNGRAKCGENVKSIWELKGMKWEYKWKVIWSHQMCWDSPDDDAAAADSTHRPFISMPACHSTCFRSQLSMCRHFIGTRSLKSCVWMFPPPFYCVSLSAMSVCTSTLFFIWLPFHMTQMANLLRWTGCHQK